MKHTCPTFGPEVQENAVHPTPGVPFQYGFHSRTSEELVPGTINQECGPDHWIRENPGALFAYYPEDMLANTHTGRYLSTRPPTSSFFQTKPD